MMDLRFPDGFLWGASTSAHQTEGNNVSSDWWQTELVRPEMEHSGDAVDSYHRYEQDMRLLADAGLDAYRFSIEWARIEPVEGAFSRAELAHYRRMIETARSLGLEPVVTLHHFSEPQWFTDLGSWLGPRAIELFVRYVRRAAEILDGVAWVVTINEPNMVALMKGMARSYAATGELPSMQSPPDEEIGRVLVRAHTEAVTALRELVPAKLGWSVATQAILPTPGNEVKHAEVQYLFDNLYLEASRGDDFVGVQSYSSRLVDENGLVPVGSGAAGVLPPSRFEPHALGIALRQAWEVTEHTPLLVTENGIDTEDDALRAQFIREAVAHLHAAVEDGLDVRGYLHWSALDNFEWGSWHPRYGLIGVDRATFERTPKPSLGVLGSIARASSLGPRREGGDRADGV
jgi:beta-glucosidase